MKVCVCVTRNWYKKVTVMLYSLMYHNDVEDLYLITEDDDIPFIDHFDGLHIININNYENKYIKSNGANVTTYYTKMSFARLYLSKMIDEDKIIYIDADTVINGSLQDMWDFDISNYALIGVHENGDWDNHLKGVGFNNTYINSGVLVMNLKYIKENKLDDKMIDLINKEYHRYPDQDVINLICKGLIYLFDINYNAVYAYRKEKNIDKSKIKVYHYNWRNKKGWDVGSIDGEVWWSYFSMFNEENGNRLNEWIRK